MSFFSVELIGEIEVISNKKELNYRNRLNFTIIYFMNSLFENNNKNIGHRWVKKDISILMPKNVMFAPKGDNLELFEWYLHFKSHLGKNELIFLELFF